MSQATEHLESRRIYAWVALQIETLIRDGVYNPGDYLPPERELAQRFQVSRSSVREGIIALEVKGYVDVRAGAGVAILQRPDSQPPGESGPGLSTARARIEIEVSPFDVLHARLLIEPECAALAAENATDAQIRGIAKAYRRNVRDNENQSTTYPGDRLFHIRIAEASGNAVYAATIRRMLRRYGNLFQHLQRLYTPGDMHKRSEAEHLDILTALEDRKPLRARHAMQAHLHSVLAVFSRDL